MPEFYWEESVLRLVKDLGTITFFLCKNILHTKSVGRIAIYSILKFLLWILINLRNI